MQLLNLNIGKIMKTLVQYLSELNTSDNSWGLYVDPKDINNYRIGQLCFENGGLLDDFIFIGNLYDLSFGHQSDYEALQTIFESNTNFKDKEKSDILYNQKKVIVKKEGLIKAYFENRLDKSFYNYLKTQVDELTEMWSTWEAEIFIEQSLPEILENK